MKTMIRALIVAIAILLCGCKSEEYVIAKDLEDGFEVNDLRITNPDSIITYQKIDLRTFNVLKTARGSEYYFYPSFVQITKEDTILVKVSEFFSPEDILTSGLTSTTSENLLVSSGMFHIELLTTDSVLLNIEVSNPILARFPVDKVDNENRLYKGSSEQGTLIWSKPTVQNTDFLIPIPDSLLEFNTAANECITPRKWISDLKEGIYQNTYVHTLEFESRLAVLVILGCYSANSGIEVDRSLLDVYLNNIDQDLFKSDSLALQIAKHKYGIKIDTMIDLSKWEWSDNYVMSYVYLKLEELYKLKHKRPFDVTRDDIDLYTMLRDNIVSQRMRTKEMMTSIGYLFNVDLGWNNIDKLYTETKMEKGFKLVITVKNADTTKELFATLVCPEQNVYIPLQTESYKDESNIVLKNGGYNIPPKVPTDLFISTVETNSIRYYYESIQVSSDTTLSIELNKTYKDKYIKD